MTKAAAKKPAKTAAPKAKVATKPKAKPKAAAKPKPKPKVDWVAELKTGQPGVKKWNKLTWEERGKIKIAGADLSSADLSKVHFSYHDLRGVDFTNCTLGGALLSNARVDETTKWPTDVKLADAVTWVGKGPDPRKVATPEEKALPKPADFGGFMTRLKQVTDPAKLDKATKMLRAEKFRLYAKVAADHLVGVVKSQGDPDLVYSCRLAADGKYGCCTQNLFI